MNFHVTRLDEGLLLLTQSDLRLLYINGHDTESCCKASTGHRVSFAMSFLHLNLFYLPPVNKK